MTILNKFQNEYEQKAHETKMALKQYTQENNIQELFPPGIDEKFDRLLGDYQKAKWDLQVWNES